MKYYIKNKISINKLARLLKGLDWCIMTEDYYAPFSYYWTNQNFSLQRNFIYIDLDKDYINNESDLEIQITKLLNSLEEKENE